MSDDTPRNRPPVARPSESLHKQIDRQEDDPFMRSARVTEETSSDGKFSTYEVAPKQDPLAGDLILQYRGEPKRG